MAIPVMIIGKSGSGKSASLRNFKENVGVINVMGKPFPFKGQPVSLVTQNYDEVKRTVAGAKTQSIVIDDAGYLITEHFMKGHSQTGKGNDIFALYNNIGDYFYNLIRFISNEVSAEKIVYVMMHEEKSDIGDIKPKTIGKMLDEKVCLEGLFTIVLRCVKENGIHVFKTQSSGFDVTKSPMGMFDAGEIDNDLKAVDDAIRNYYEIGGSQNAKAS